MAGLNSSRQGWPRLPRWLVTGLTVGLPVLGVGCGMVRLTTSPEQPSAAHLQRDTPSRPEQHATAPAAVTPVQHVVAAETVPAPTRELPITLDAVFRLAEQHNPRIGQARERLHESLLTQAQKSRLWLPNLFAGMGYYRHEGGIQDQNGQLIHSSTGALSPGLTIQSEIDLREATFQEIDSQRRVWQEKASLTQVNSEVLLDAALTYVDLLTARRGEGILRELEAYETKLLDKAEKVAKGERAAKAIVEGIKGTLSNRQQLLSQMRQKGDAASAKLVYLLGLPPQTVLVPVDAILAPIELVDIAAGPDRLVAQALAQGPGIREIQGILGVIQLGLDKSTSIHNLLPSFQINAYEGAFGAGPGGSMQWDNRLDVAVQMRWNLTQLCQSDFQRTVARSKQTQAMWNYAEIQGKLAASVLEACSAIEAGRTQIGLSATQMTHASENYRLSDRLLAEGSSPGDVLLSIRSMEQAHFNHLSSISAHNKAQIRLLLLLGVPCTNPVGPVPVPPPGAKPSTPKPLVLPAPTALPAPIYGGPDGSILKTYAR